MEATRAGEENDVEASITVVGISNDPGYGDRLDTRVESSFARTRSCSQRTMQTNSATF